MYQVPNFAHSKFLILTIFVFHRKTPSHFCRSNFVLTEHFQFDSDFPWRPLFVFWFNFFWLVGTSNPRCWLVKNSVTSDNWKSPKWRRLLVPWRCSIGNFNGFFVYILVLFYDSSRSKLFLSKARVIQILSNLNNVNKAFCLWNKGETERNKKSLFFITQDYEEREKRESERLVMIMQTLSFRLAKKIPFKAIKRKWWWRFAKSM